MIANIKKDAETRMHKSVDALKHELQRLRTGRASTALVEHLKVPYYGNDVPLSQVANVAVSDARSLTITPWEKSMVGAGDKAILGSDLGLTPTTAGVVIRINLPALTEERRKELGKHVHHEGEAARWQCATCGATRCSRSRTCSRTRRSPRTRSGAPRRTSRSSPTASSRTWTASSRPRRRS